MLAGPDNHLHMGILSRFSWVRAGFFVMAAGCNNKLGDDEDGRISDCQAKPRPMSDVVRGLGIDRGRMVGGAGEGGREVGDEETASYVE